MLGAFFYIVLQKKVATKSILLKRTSCELCAVVRNYTFVNLTHKIIVYIYTHLDNKQYRSTRMSFCVTLNSKTICKLIKKMFKFPLKLGQVNGILIIIKIFN